jgi:predicted nucleic acid-binding protein
VHARKSAVEHPWERTFLGFTVTRHGTRLEVLDPLRHASALRSGRGTERWCARHTWPCLEVVRGYRMLAQILRDFAVSPVLPFDAAVATVFDGLVAHGVRIGRMDLRITSIALSRGIVLVTRNVRDFGRVPELRVENWTA